MVTTPTRGNNILDLYLTNSHSLVKTVNIVPGILDHDIVVVESDLRPRINKPKPRNIFKYSQADMVKVKQELKSFSDKFIKDYSCKSVNENWEMFCNKITDTINTHVPSKRSTSRFTLPWLSNELRKKFFTPMPPIGNPILN